MTTREEEPTKDGRRVVLVTGGSRGIGKAIARAFATLGDRLVLCARGEEALQEAATELESDGAVVDTVVCDLTDESSVRDMIDATVDRNGRIDVLVNNAGIYGPIGSLHDNDLAAWVETVEVNSARPGAGDASSRAPDGRSGRRSDHQSVGRRCDRPQARLLGLRELQGGGGAPDRGAWHTSWRRTVSVSTR